MALTEFSPVHVELTNAIVTRGDIEVLRGVSLSAAPGEVLGLIGANGAGKSTLLSAMAGLLPLTSGQSRVTESDGRPAAITRIGYVLQKPVMLRRSVGANLDFAMSAAGLAPATRKPLKAELMAMFKLDEYEHTSAYHLSQGERQRLAVARVLAMRPGVLMLDEATNSLDQTSIELLEHHVTGLAAKGMAVIWVTHSLDQARRVADRIVLLDGGTIARNEKADDFFASSASPSP